MSHMRSYLHRLSYRSQLNSQQQNEAPPSGTTWYYTQHDELPFFTHIYLGIWQQTEVLEAFKLKN